MGAKGSTGGFGARRSGADPHRIADVDIPSEFGHLQAADLTAWDGSAVPFARVLDRITELVRLPPETPHQIADEWAHLVTHLDQLIPPKGNDNLVVASWNVRQFGRLTADWMAGPKSSPKRDWRAGIAIAEVVSRFDVVLLSEVTRQTDALEYVLGLLGDEWSALYTEPDLGDTGNGERLAMLCDTRRVRPSGLVGRVTTGIESDDLDVRRQRSVLNSAVQSFSVRPVHRDLIGQLTFLVVHVSWGAHDVSGADAERLAARLRELGDEAARNGQCVIVLGDFSVDRAEDPLYLPFARTLTVPDQLHDAPRTVFGGGTEKFYDQIAWFSNRDEGPCQSLRCAAAGYVDFLPAMHRGQTHAGFSFQISDHYPLWVELRRRAEPDREAVLDVIDPDR